MRLLRATDLPVLAFACAAQMRAPQARTSFHARVSSTGPLATSPSSHGIRTCDVELSADCQSVVVIVYEALALEAVSRLPNGEEMPR
jgi:hypothetical protein